MVKMGIDLTIYPQQFDMKWKLCDQGLTFDRDYKIFGQICDDRPKIEPHPCPDDWQIQIYDDDGIRDCKEDCYGTKLTYLFAFELKKLDMSDISEWNKAIKAFIDALPDDMKVILWWH
jgi:hypothetical protein